jgi:hypothetical protein
LAINFDILGRQNQKERKKGSGNQMKSTMIAFIAAAMLGLAHTATAQTPSGRIATIDLN